MKNRIRKKNKKWKCNVCGTFGKKWQSSWRANRSGRQHINRFHDGTGKLMLLYKPDLYNDNKKYKIKKPKSEPTA